MSYPKTQAFAEKYFYDLVNYNYVEGTIDEFRDIFITSPNAHINLINDFEDYHASIPPYCHSERRYIIVEAMAKRVDWDKVHKYIKEYDENCLGLKRIDISIQK